MAASRAEARAEGLCVYFTGKACVHGHRSERLTSNGNCKACLSTYLKAYFQDPVKRAKKTKAHVEARRLSPEMRARDVAGYNRRYHSDPLFAMQSRMRARANAAFRSIGAGKPASTEALLGADWGSVKAHIERQFAPDMGWANRAQWHIDHIIPLKTAKDQDDLIRLCHYRNLQPLWAADNLRKGSK